MANYNNRVNDTIVSGTSENDVIYNNATNVTINAGDGNDSIGNHGGNQNGNDFIDGGDGADTIDNHVGRVTISGGAGDDSIYNGNDNYVSISGDDGNDSINNNGQNSTIDGGTGNDYIFNRGQNSTISGGGGSDTIYNNGRNSTIDAGDGDDSITNYGQNSTISGGGGSDTIYNTGANVKIDAGDGDDSITNNGHNTTIDGGAGDDFIEVYLRGNNDNVIQYAAGEGNDSIRTVSIANLTGSTLNISLTSGTLDETILGDNNSILLGIGTNTLTVEINPGEVISVKDSIGQETLIGNGRTSVTVEGNNFTADSLNNNGYYIYNKNNDATITASSIADGIDNRGANVSISAGESNDYIENYGEGTTIDAGADDDYIYNYSTVWNEETQRDETIAANNVLIDAGLGNDTIWNSGLNVTINGGSGDDYISNYSTAIWDEETQRDKTILSSNVTIDAGLGNDEIYNGWSKNVSISGGDGNDDIHNDGANVTINAGDGNDTIENNGSTVTIDAGDGDDEIKNYGDNVTINAGTGSDSIHVGWGNKIEINTGAGDDYVSNMESSSVTVDTGAGNDSIENWGYYTTINAGDGSDTIFNGGSNAKIFGGAGNDSIDNAATNVTLEGGAGDDSISNSSMGFIYVYRTGDGNDVIEGFTENSYLQIVDGTYSTAVSGSDIIVTVGEGSITVVGAAELSKLNIVGEDFNPLSVVGSNNDEIITNIFSGATIDALGGNDTITNYAENVTINAGEGNDSIYNDYGGENISINGGAGNDSIHNYGSNSTITAGLGNDYIYNSGSNVTLNGGEGADTIENEGSNSFIDGGAGDDSINNSGDNAIIDAGVGNDLISNNNYRTSINGGTGNDSISNNGEKSTVEGGAGDDSIYNSATNFVYVYRTGDGNDLIEGFDENSYLQIVDGTYSTAVSGSDIIVTVGEGNITILGAAELSTLNIVTGEDFYMSKVVGTDDDDDINNSTEDVMIDALDGNDTIYNDAVNVTINGGAGNDSIGNHGGHENGNDLIDGGEGNDTIDNHVHRVTIRGGAGNDYIATGDRATIEGGDGDDTIFGDINNGDSITIRGGAGKDSINNFGMNSLIDGGEDDDYIGNGYEYPDYGMYSPNNAAHSTINGGSGNDTIYNGSDYSTILGDEGNDYIVNSGGNAFFQYTAGDGDDTIEGFNENSYLQIINGSYTTQQSGDDIIVTVGDGSILLSGAATLSSINIVGTYNNPLEVTGTEGDDSINNTLSGATINALGGKDTIDNGGENVLIDGGDGNDSISNWRDNVTIFGGAGADSIYNYNKGVSINAGDGNDYIFNNANDGDTTTIDGGAGDDTIEVSSNFNPLVINGGDGDDSIAGIDEGGTINGGKGNDTISVGSGALFTYTSGDDNDIIFGFNAQSTLQIDGDSYSTQQSGNDIIVTVGDGSILLKNAANLSTIKIVGEFEESSLDTGTEGDDTIDNSLDSATIQTFSGDDYISNSGDNVSIDSGDGNDYIYNNAVNVTINAGAGNDSIGNHGGHQGANDLIDGGDGDDYIDNHVHDVIIRGGAGNDYIETGDRATIEGGDGDDTIFGDINNGDSITIRGGAGNDSISNFGMNSLIDGGEDDDYIGNGYGYPDYGMYSPDNAMYSTINGGSGNDTIYNGGDSATILGDAGNDYIVNSGENVLIQYSSGDGNDTIYGFNSTSTLQISGSTYYTQASGNDIIVIVGGGSILLKDVTTLSNDNIDGTYKKVLINGTEDADTIKNTDAELKINAGAGNDSIRNSGDNVTINGGADDDTITNSGENVVFQYAEGDGNDTINGFDETSILQIGDGTGTYSTQVSGSDLIVNVGEGSILLKDVANSAVSIAGEYKNPLLILGTNGADEINNTISGATIQALSGSDEVINSGNAVLIDAGAGADEITNSGADVTINGGDGRDTISNSGEAISINGGAGNDLINFNGGTATINVSEGNDTIYIGTSLDASFTVEDFDKDDVISLEYPIDSLTAIDGGIIAGNVTIGGLSSVKTDPAWTLNGKIATYTEGSYGGATLFEDGKIITYSDLSVGETLVTINGVTSTNGLTLDGKVVSVGAAALSGVMDSVAMYGDGYTLTLGEDVTLPESVSAGWKYDSSLWVATYNTFGTTAGYRLEGNIIIYEEASGETIEISGVISSDGITVDTDKKIVTVGASALQSGGFSGIVSVSDGYTLALGEDVAVPESVSAGFSYDDGVATYNTTGATAGYIVSNNEIFYNPANGGETLFTVTGVKSADGLEFSGDTVTVAASALNGTNVTISGDYKLALGSDAPTPQPIAGGWTHSGTTATYTAAATSAGYSVVNNEIVYAQASGGNSFTVTGVKSADGLTFSGDTVTIAASSLDGKNVSISDGYKLALASDAPTPQPIAGGWTHSGTTATYKAAATTAGYSVVNNEIVYAGANGGNSFTVTGVKSADGLTFSGDTVTVAASALNGTNVSISDSNYKLALASDAPKAETVKEFWTATSTGATCKDISTTEGYALVDNQIVYTSAVDRGSFTVNGVKDIDGLSLSGTTVTVARRALGSSNVTISNGYTLALASDVSEPTTTQASLTYSNGTATYKSEATTSGYKLDNNQITYTAASGDEVEISGVKSADGISVEGKTITLSETALNKQQVEVSNEDYKLALANGVATPSTVAAGWTLTDDIKATYRNNATIEGYALSNNEINYTAASGGATIVEVSGVKDTKGLAIDQNEKIVAVYASALDPANTVTISDDYTLELGDDVDKSEPTTGWIKLENGNIAYQTNLNSTGYKVEDNAISYVEAVEGETLAELSGIAANTTPIIDGEKNLMTFVKDNFESNVSVNSSTFNKFEFTAGDYEDKAFTSTDKIDEITNAGSKLAINGGEGNDKINNIGSDVTISGGTGNDNVTMSGGDEGNNIFSYTDGDGKDILYNFNANDKIQILGTNEVEESIKNKDVIFKVGKGTITVRDAVTSDMAITLVGAADNEIISANTYTADGIISKDKIVLSTTLKKPYTQADNISVVDGSQVIDGARIIGNDNGGTLLGGAGKDTLISSQNDFELTGGAGNDIFVFGGGKDTIFDYSQKGAGGSDKVSIASSLTATDYEIDGDDVILNYGTGNELTILDGKGKEITFAGKKSFVNVYADEGVFDAKKKSLILAAGTNKNFSAAKYSKLVTIVDNELAITGNKKANLIIASKSNTTLNGGKGKDTLVGGDGVDVFIYDNKSGNKTIQDYGAEDIISLGKGAEISQVTTKKNNVVLKVGTNTITIEGVAKSQFTFSQDGATKTYNDGKLIIGNSVTLDSDFKGTFDLNSADYEQYRNISAELGKKAVKLTGDEDDNILIGGKSKDELRGGDNNDTLNGGKGNDSLWGGDGADTFVYKAGEGTDTIMDYNYDDGDLLQILDKRGKEISKGAVKKWAFDGDDLTLSIKGGGKLILVGVGTSASVNINGNVQSF